MEPSLVQTMSVQRRASKSPKRRPQPHSDCDTFCCALQASGGGAARRRGARGGAVRGGCGGDRGGRRYTGCAVTRSLTNDWSFSHGQRRAAAAAAQPRAQLAGSSTARCFRPARHRAFANPHLRVKFNQQFLQLTTLVSAPTAEHSLRGRCEGGPNLRQVARWLLLPRHLVCPGGFTAD